MKNLGKYIIGSIATIVILFIGVYFHNQPKKVSLGSIGDGQAYNSTTTDSTWNTPAAITGGTKILKLGSGTLGSVVITNSTAGAFTLYDASTTINGGVYGTTTLAKIYASVAAGTYTFDIAYSRGLIVEFQSPNVASSTITWR